MAPQSSEPRATRAGSVAEDTSGLLQTLQGHVEDIRALLQCGICVRPLYEPYTLACGHTFCYGCLTSWFGSGRLHKTCPDCRAQVKTQPAPAYLVRTIVQMFTSRAELLDKGETTAEHTKNQREEAEKLEADKSNVNPQTGGLFQGCFKPKIHPNGPILDVEDGVTRCPNCAWELEEDSCLNCGYHVDDSATTDYSEGFSDSTDYNDDMEDIDDDFGDYDGGWMDDHAFEHLPFAAQYFYGVPPHLPHHHHHHHHHVHDWGFAPSGSVAHTSDDEDESGSEDEDEEMDSFIDDDDDDEIDGDNDSEVDSGTDHSTVVGDHSYADYDEYDTGADGSVSQDGDEQDHTSISGESEGLNNPGDDDGDNDDDDDEDDEPVRPATRRRLQGPYNPLSLSGSRTAINGISRHNPRRPPRYEPRHIAAGASASNAINVEDDSDDEMPVSAIRRARLNRN